VGRADVVLVNMPFAAVERPSLGLGQLKALLSAASIDAAVVYPNLRFAAMAGAHSYQMLGRMSMHDYVLEWVFTAAAFPDFIGGNSWPFRRWVANLDETLVERIVPGGDRNDVWQKLLRLRAEAPAFVRDTAIEILAQQPRIVGCTSTFQQHVASLALLRSIRELQPSVITMMGGANCETRMGLATHKSYEWVDYVVSGEADGIIAPLCRGLLDGGRELPTEALPDGVLAPQHRAFGYPPGPAGGDGAPRALFNDLESLPTPDLDDYFAALGGSPLATAVRPAVVLETSRGCWWGAISHCTFCGLNGGSMGFRTKSPGKALAEFEGFAERFGVRHFHVADNILALEYFDSLIPMLAASRLDANIFFETKSNLKREQVRALAAAGVHWIQPGIESLSSAALKLMGKGVPAWSNVLLLKWARESRLHVIWFMLWGFPGESDVWYEEMAGWLPLIAHLQPSRGLNRLTYDRFSPYHFRAAEYGLDLRPCEPLRSVLDMPDADLADQAYFFDDANEKLEGHPSWQVRGTRRPGIEVLQAAHERWVREFNGDPQALLTMHDRDGRLHVCDTRRCAPRAEATLEGAARAACLAAGDGPTSSRLLHKLVADFGLEIDAEELEPILADLREQRLLLTLDGHHVALPLQVPVPAWPRRFDFPGGAIDAEESLRLENDRPQPSLGSRFLALVDA
jgi:ribosomal peptide maturation radical SAM protein 1